MHKDKHKTFFQRLKSFLITTVVGGFVVVLPIAILVAVIQILYRFVSNLVSPMRGLIHFSGGAETWIVDLISVLIIVGAFFVIGLIVRTSIGRRIHDLIERRLLSQIPLYPTLRNTVRQFFGQKKMPFSRVVIAKVLGARMTGFVTDERRDRTYTVFVPTAPNPTNGFVIHAKERELEFLDVRPEDALRTIIGMGTGSYMLFGHEPPGKEERYGHVVVGPNVEIVHVERPVDEKDQTRVTDQRRHRFHVFAVPELEFPGDEQKDREEKQVIVADHVIVEIPVVRPIVCHSQVEEGDQSGGDRPAGKEPERVVSFKQDEDRNEKSQGSTQVERQPLEERFEPIGEPD